MSLFLKSRQSSIISVVPDKPIHLDDNSRNFTIGNDVQKNDVQKMVPLIEF